ncbi:MAG: diaminopimelate epimerase [Ignavibacteriales bacterium]
MKFTKMHGCGNDYVYVNCFEEGTSHDWPRLSREVADRHTGVGSDGLILIGPASSPAADFRMRIFNADGSEGEMCGNGIRCFAKYVYDRGLTTRTSFAVETLAGIMRPELLVQDDGQVRMVRVDMGVPSFRRGDVPMKGEPGEEATGESLRVGGRSYTVTGVRMGNPNCVTFVEDAGAVPVTRIGPLIEKHPLFPQKANVEFVQVLGNDVLRMRVWERGSGLTMACGTGACASAVAAHKMGFTGRLVHVILDGGALEIEWRPDGRVFMTGPAEEICTGVFTKWREGPGVEEG